MAKKPTGRINNEGVFEAELPPKNSKKPDPPYRIYAGSKIAVSKAVGKMMQKKYEAAVKVNETIRAAWDQSIAYYNNNQTMGVAQSSAGMFHRGEGTENIVYSNINLMVPAVYNKNPDFAISTVDKADEPLVNALKPLLNSLFRRKDYLNAKYKMKKAVGMGLLTNFGVVKIGYTKKDDSVEHVLEELNRISKELEKVKTVEEAQDLEGQLMALEAQAEVAERSGPKLNTVNSHYLTIDPYAEDADGLDANWMGELTYISTTMLKAQYTLKNEDGSLVLVYKPTHKVSLGKDGEGNETTQILAKLGDGSIDSESWTTEERLGYLHEYSTECVYIWDKPTRRLFLFLKDDWSWPIWVWDDPLQLSRFFPYFFLQFGFTTGGTTSVGEVSYYLDQQDEVNDINRQIAKIRRIIFDYIFYNSETMSPEDAELVSKVLRGDRPTSSKNMIGLKVEDGEKLSDQLHSLVPPSANYEPFFNKEAILNAVNRITNTSDALRGVQFKTNTNEAAVQTYQDAVKLSVGAKVDVVEDVLSDMGHAIAELCLQNMDPEEVVGIIGERLAQGWRNMTTEEFNANYSCEVVAGSTEKPNSAFKKKDAIQAAQAIGQVNHGAPGASLMVVLRLLEQAFPEVTVKPEDWDLLKQEVTANIQKGVSTGGSGGKPGAGMKPEEVQALKSAPPELKKKANEMRKGGASDEQVIEFLKQQMAGRPGPAPQEKTNGPAQ